MATSTGPFAAPAAATEFGMSDGRPVLFDAPHLHELAFTRARLVLPWDAASREGSWHVWLRRAELQGFPVLVAPTFDEGQRCGGAPCPPPTAGAYAVALAALLARYPGIEAVEAWNEPNHSSQPTASRPDLAASYFDAAAVACVGRCIAVAGNLLDAPSMAGYLAAYRASLQATPAVWGIHDYYDATYFTRSGLDEMLAITDGPVWLTEVGGLVTFKPPGGGGLPYDESRAADSLRWMFTLAGRNPRVERMYLYGMWQEPFNPFDSALLRVDNSERESMAVARAYIGPRKVKLSGPQAPELPVGGDTPGVPKGVSPPAHAQLPPAAREADGGRLRIGGKRLVVRRRTGRVAVAVRCVGASTCSGRLQFVVPGWRYSRALHVPAGAKRTFTLRLPALAARRLGHATRRAAYARACDADQACVVSPRVPLVRR